MYVKQLSVFIENKKGTLAEFTRLLGEHEIDMFALTIADTTDFGILRAIVSDVYTAQDILQQAGYIVTITDVVAVSVPDRPGGLADILAKLCEENISVEYLYSFVRHIDVKAVILLRLNDPDRAVKVFQENGFDVLSPQMFA